MTKINKLAESCLHCKKKPCTMGCPLKNDIPSFIEKIKEKKEKEAFDILSKTTVLPAICGLICPKEQQCAGKCVKRFSEDPVKIGELESFIGNYAFKNSWKIPCPKKTKHKVLVIGGGPAGLTCAAFLRKKGIGVTIVEKQKSLGGLLSYGIPDFRLPKKIVNETINSILNLGVNVILKKELGIDFFIEDVIDKYDAIFIGIGGNCSNLLSIPGEDLNGVYGGNELLEQELMIPTKEKSFVVIGGGNVSLDVARSLKRRNAKKVFVTYRRREEDMRVDKMELEEAKKEGIDFLFQTNIIKIHGNNVVEKVEAVKTQMNTEPNKSSSPINLENSNFYIPCDFVIRAIGSHPEERILKEMPISVTKKNTISIKKDGRTSHPKIFAGGDVAGVKATVACAARSGRNAAFAIIRYLKES